jgi:hypothetical protein
MPDLRIYVFPQYKPGDALAPEEAGKAVQAAEEFPRLLLEHANQVPERLL